MKSLNIRMLLLIIMIIFTGAFVSGCNTVQGFGEDLEEAGDHIEDTAEDAAD